MNILGTSGTVPLAVPLALLLASLLACSFGDPAPARVDDPLPVAPPIAAPAPPAPGSGGAAPTRAEIEGSWDVLEGSPGAEFVLTNKCNADPPNVTVSNDTIDVGYGQEDVQYTILGGRAEGDALVLGVRSEGGKLGTARLRWADDRRVLAWSGEPIDWRTVKDASAWPRLKECCGYEAVEYEYATVAYGEDCPPAPEGEVNPFEPPPGSVAGPPLDAAPSDAPVAPEAR